MPLASCDLLPTTPDWARGLARQPGSRAKPARSERLEQFLDDGARSTTPTTATGSTTHGTSRLSPHLHFGEISPRQVWHAVATPRERAAAG